MEWTFRGWDATGQKGWVYGDLVHNKKVTRTGLEDRVMVGGYEVVPESVGAFTGVYDGKRNKVFEGDIVRCRTYIGKKIMRSNIQTRLVYFFDGSFLAKLIDNSCVVCDGILYDGLPRTLLNIRITSVIGNIFERKNQKTNDI